MFTKFLLVVEDVIYRIVIIFGMVLVGVSSQARTIYTCIVMIVNAIVVAIVDAISQSFDW